MKHKCSLYKRQVNNRGFSLIELIIVIAMLAILIGVVGASLNYLNGPEASRAVSSMDAELNEAKTGAMSRNSEYIILRYITLPNRADYGSDSDYNIVRQQFTDNGINNEGFYVEKHISTIQNDKDKSLDFGTVEYTMIASKKVTIKYNASSTDADDGTEINKDGSNAIRIEFDRSTGRLKKLRVGNLSADSRSGYLKVDSSSWSEPGDISNLTFKCGLRQGAIEFVPLTGKHFIK